MTPSTKSQYEIQSDARDFHAWLHAETTVAPDEDMRHLRRILSAAIENELTPKQRLYMAEYYVDGRTVGQIALRHKVCRSTVSRVLKCGRKRLRRVLRYCSPRLFDAQGQRSYNKAHQEDAYDE